MTSSAGRDQSPSEAQRSFPTPRQQDPDALETRHRPSANPPDACCKPAHAGIVSHRNAEDPSCPSADASQATFERDTKLTLSPSLRSASPATASVSSADNRQHSLRAAESRISASRSMALLIATAKLAAFTDVFLSGLIIPLIPSVLESRAQVPGQQAQIWTSVLVSAYGGAFAVVSPLMPLLTRQGPPIHAVLLAGLATAAAAIAILHLSSNLYLLIFARALQGLAAAALAGVSSGMLATVATVGGQTGLLAFLTPALTQNLAMTVAPAVAGLLHDYYDANVVFYFGYALVALNILLGLVSSKFAPTRQAGSRNWTEGRLASEPQSSRYGTIQSSMAGSSGRSSRSVSPRSAIPAGSTQRNASGALPGTAAWSSRLFVAMYGYAIVGFLASALQGVLPLFVERRFNWSVSAAGLMFIPLSAPAALVGPLFGMLTDRVPNSARFVTGIGFFSCLPAFLYLGKLRANTPLVQRAFLATLGSLSLATGLCGDPLVREITHVAGSSAASDSWNAAAQTLSLPYLANAWGSMAGPLFAGAVAWVCSWETMNKSLAIVSASAGVLSLLFLQGWVGNPYPDIRRSPGEVSPDEESAPLLANDHSNRRPYGQGEAYRGVKRDSYTHSDDLDDVSPHTRDDHRRRSHRRHFSVDNFSVATTAGPGSIDSSTSSVRFQAALETPVLGPPTSNGSGKRPPPPTSDTCASRSSGTNAERRYVMREAPHAPATDPLLAAGSLYVIDEERDAGQGRRETQRQKRRVVVFAEGTAPPELLARHRHHVVAINALDGTAHMVADSTDDHAVHVVEEPTGEGEAAFEEATSRRYVVVVVEGEDDE